MAAAIDLRRLALVVLAMLWLLLAGGTASADERITPVTVSPSPAPGSLLSPAFSPDGRLLALAHPGRAASGGRVVGDRGVVVFRVDGAARVLREVRGSPFDERGVGFPWAATFSPNGRLLATGNSSRSVSIFAVDRRTGKLREIPHSPFWIGTGGDAEAVAFSPGGGLLAAANDSFGSVSVFSVGWNGALTRVRGSPFSTGEGSHPSSVQFSPNGSFLAVNNGYQVEVFDVSQTTGALTAAPGSPYYIRGNQLYARAVAFSPDSRLLAVGYQAVGPGQIAVFAVDQATGALSQVPGSPYADGQGNYFGSMAFSPGGKLLLAPGADGSTLTLFNVAPDGSLTPLSSPALATNRPGDADAAFSPTGGLIAGIGGPLTVYSISPFDKAIVLPNNRFVVTNRTAHHDGTITFNADVPGPGTIDFAALASGPAVARPAVFLQPGKGQRAYARSHVAVGQGGVIHLRLKPNQWGRRFLARHRR